MTIIMRQQTDLSAYEEGKMDGAMRREVLEQRSYPHVRDGHLVASTLSEAITQERNNAEGLLQEVKTDPLADPEDVSYLQGKLCSLS